MLDVLDQLGLSTVTARAMQAQGQPVGGGGRRYSNDEIDAALLTNGAALNVEARLTLKMAMANAGLIGR